MKIFAISDNHGKLDFKVPSCNLLLIGGDVCPDYAPGTSYGSSMQEDWLNSKFSNWINEQPIKYVMGTLGNHDFVRPAKNGVFPIPDLFHVDDLCEIDSLKIWFSPWSNTFGGWAWMQDPDKLALNYDQIPEGVDIIVSHQPPYGYGDKLDPRFMMSDESDPHVGSKELLKTIDKVKPKVVICGHIHSGHGIYSHTRPDGGVTTIYNVALVNEDYKLTYAPTEIIL